MDGTELASGLGQDLAAAPAARLRGAVAREPFVVRSTVGRLVELQLLELGQPEDVGRISSSLLSAFGAIEGPPILLADHRLARPFPHEVGDAWSREMRALNTRVVRSAILLDRANETFNLQLARVVRCAGSSRRRWFYDSAELMAWLLDVLTPAEEARLDELLG